MLNNYFVIVMKRETYFAYAKKKNAEHQRGNQAAQVCFEALNLSWVELSNEDEVS